MEIGKFVYCVLPEDLHSKERKSVHFSYRKHPLEYANSFIVIELGQVFFISSTYDIAGTHKSKFDYSNAYFKLVGEKDAFWISKLNLYNYFLPIKEDK